MWKVPISLSVVTPPQHGTLTGLAPDLVYHPNLLYFGPDSFTFTTNNGQLDSASSTVNITVNQLNHPPTFVVGPNQVVTDTSPKTVPNWATDITDGVGDTGQTVTFALQADNRALCDTTGCRHGRDAHLSGCERCGRYHLRHHHRAR